MVLMSEAEEFEDVGKFLFASGEAEIREKLRSRGIQEYLMHPLSLEGLRSVVGQAFRRMCGDEYLLLQAVGRGATGVVHRAKRLRDGGAFALKEINTKRMSKTAKQEVERESQLLQELRWPTVLFLVDTWENRTDRLRYILMPLLDGGSLLQRTEAASKEGSVGRASAERICEWYAQSLHGLTYLHWRGVLHKDIKPGNLILGLDDRSLLIGDLGSAVLLPGVGPHPMKRTTLKGQVCTPLYAAPEVLLDETYSTGTDIWALGTTFYEVLTLSTFFPSGGTMPQLQSAANDYDWKSGHWAADLNALGSKDPPVPELGDLVRADPLQRPAASELIGRPAIFRRLRTAMTETGALPTSLDRKMHFEEFTRIRTESDAAASMDPADPKAAVLSPQARLSAARSSAGSAAASAAGGLVRAGSGMGTSLMRAGSGAINRATGGKDRH